jgi:hypothetical protein
MIAAGGIHGKQRRGNRLNTLAEGLVTWAWAPCVPCPAGVGLLR